GPGVVVIVGDDVDQLATPNQVHDYGAVRSKPGGAVGGGQPAGHGINRDHAAPANLAREARRVRSKETGPNRRMDAVCANQDVGFDLAAIAEPGRRRVRISGNADAASAERNDLVGYSRGQGVQEVSAVRGAAGGSEARREVAAARRAGDDSTSAPVAQEPVFGFEGDRSDRVLQVD